MTHCSWEIPAPSFTWMVGRATFTTRLSSIGMKSPNTIATRTHHFRRSARASSRVCRTVLSIARAISVQPLSRSLVSECSLIFGAHLSFVNPPGQRPCVGSIHRRVPSGRRSRASHSRSSGGTSMGRAITLVTDLPGPRSAEILERKSRVVCDPLDIHVRAVIDHGIGARVTDVDGNTFLDFSAGLGCQLVGYSHPKVVQAVQRQAARFSHTDFSVIPYESYVELAERLAALTGVRDGKVALFNAGAEAVENAVKFAKAATGRSALLCFEGGFHGRTLLTMSLTSRHHPYKAGFGPFAPEVYRVPYPYPYRSAHPEDAGRIALEAIDRAFVTVVDPRASRRRSWSRSRAKVGSS